MIYNYPLYRLVNMWGKNRSHVCRIDCGVASIEGAFKQPLRPYTKCLLSYS